MAVGPRVLEAAGFPRPGRLSRLHEWWEQEHVFGYGLIVPAIVLLATLVAFPFGMAIWFSLSDYWVGSPGGFVVPVGVVEAPVAVSCSRSCSRS